MDTIRVLKLDPARVVRMETSRLARIYAVGVVKMDTAAIMRLFTPQAAKMDKAVVMKMDTARVLKINAAKVARELIQPLFTSEYAERLSYAFINIMKHYCLVPPILFIRLEAVCLKLFPLS